MTLDFSNQFCSAQNLFGNGTTVSSTDWIDIKKAQDMAGGGQAPFVEIIITTTFVGGTSAQFQLVAVDSAGANPVVLDTTRAFPIAELVAPTAGVGMTTGGTRIALHMSPQKALPADVAPGNPRSFLRVQCVNVGNNAAGAASIALVPDVPSNESVKAYPAGW